MKFTLDWLKNYLETDADANAIAGALTSLGLEVESIDNPAASLAAFTVAEILEAVQHPDADRLRVCQVRTGKDTRQIVCGAPNARAGIKVALADIGAVIPNGGFTIKASKIRGVESNGMLCSGAELGLGAESAGIIELPETAVVGEPIARSLGLDDTVIEIAVTPNRADCLGIYGIARELAAKGIGRLKPPAIPRIETAFRADRTIKLETPGCPLFAGRSIRNLKNGPSPEWLQRRLKAVGLRPISALVDVTNYFSQAFARPLHVFDAAKLEGMIHVRAARDGETLSALNDRDYILPAGACVVADERAALALGGIVGGSETGCSDDTTSIFLESAWFEPAAIAATGRALQIESDARYRFERHVDPGFTLPGIDLATRMILDLCGGEAGELVIAGHLPVPRPAIPFDPAETLRIGGVTLDAAETAGLLERLGFEVEAHGERLSVVPPSWRADVTIAADLVEEILRLRGYDALPETALPPAPVRATDPAAQIGRLRREMAGAGFAECYHFAFVEPAAATRYQREQTPGVRIVNPINAAQDRLRTSLLPNLLAAASRNFSRTRNPLALFEIGHVFHSLDAERQPLEAAAIRVGEGPEKSWDAPIRKTDAIDTKADLLTALDAMGVDPQSVQVVAGAPGYYHPGQSGTVRLGPKQVLGYFGALHPAALRDAGLDAPVHAFELLVSKLPVTRRKSKSSAVSEFPAAERDFAFVVPLSQPAGELLAVIATADKSLIRRVQLFDRYLGKGIPEDHQSLAVRITLQADDRTLTEADIVRIGQAVTDAAIKKGATLRA